MGRLKMHIHFTEPRSIHAMTTEQKLDKILRQQHFILANQEYLERLVEALFTKAQSSESGPVRSLETAHKLAEQERKKTLAAAP